MRFALVGKMDVNRDGRDDRQELKRMIQEAGGTVDFDLPPADVGKEIGHAFAPDRLVRHRRPYAAPRGLRSEERRSRGFAGEARIKRVGEVIKEARLNGIRPMTIERLLAFLGYDMNAPVVGRAEAVDSSAMRRLTAPRRTGEAAKPSIDMTTKADDMPAEKAETKAKKADTKKAADADEPQ